MNGTVNIQDLTNYLKSEGLIIVNREDYEHKINFKQVRLRAFQENLLSKSSLTIKEIVQGKLLPVTTRQSINNWIDAGKFNDEMIYKNAEGQIKIAVQEIIRIRKIKNYDY